MRPVRCVWLAVFLPVVFAGFILSGTGVAAAAARARPSGGAVLGATSSGVQFGRLHRASQTRPSLAGTTTSSSALQMFGPRTPFNPHKAIANARTTAARSAVAFPTVSCPGVGCATIAGNNGGAVTQPLALNATANGKLFGTDIEPPDQGMCAGNGYVMELINIGNMQVFNANLQPVSGITSLDTLMGLSNIGWSSGGDVSCVYDPSNGGHWFITEFVSTNTEASGGPFTGCFSGQLIDSCREGIAVSTGSNPLTSSWNVYFLDPNTWSPNDPGHGFLLNDFTKIATTNDAFLLFYDEFDTRGPYPPCPAADCLSFNGAQEFAIDKNALESGAASPNIVHENMGTDPAVQPPDGNCMTGSGAGTDCWAQIIPVASPNGQFDNANGGTGFMVGALDFNAFATLTGTGDNRIAVFHWTGLSHITSNNCSACGKIKFGSQLFTGVQSYTDDGQACLVSQGDPCGLAPQRAGLLDLGHYCAKYGFASSQPCPENGLATNGDGATQATYDNGQIWFGVTTLLNEQFGAASETHAGAAYWVLNTAPFDATGRPLTITSQGYVAAAHEDMLFPAVAGGSTEALLSFTLSGDGGPTGADGGGYFPSSGYGLLSPTAPGLVGGTAFVADQGKGPQDGFTEYQPFPGFPGNGTRPRWGDYGAAAFVPGTGFYFASEYIQSAPCKLEVFRKDNTCGGTRDQAANFGTSVNLVKSTG
jgi:hypothetical protein